LFQKHYIKTGLIEKSHGKFFSKIFEYRQMGDYADFIEFNAEQVKSWLGTAKEFLNELKTVILQRLKS
jgi:uncharacterized protein (UPF0332 family)